ncbi:MAG: murein biosynthesis integral membrane protein MurJ [Planctomycetota bacterium]
MSDAKAFVAPARLIAVLTLLSRILGLAREMAYAYFFGAGPALSAFRVAYQLPNLARRLFGEGALSAAFIPTLSDCLHQRGELEARRLAGTVLTLLAILLTALVVVGQVGIAVAQEWRATPSLTLRLTTLMLPYMPLVCMTAFLGAALNVLRRFAAPAFAPVLVNLCMLAGICGGAWGLGWSDRSLLDLACAAVLAGGVAQLTLVLVNLRRAGFQPILALQWRRPDVRQMVAQMGPMILGMSVLQINTFVDSLIALFLVPDGRGPAVLGFAQFFYQFPLGVLGVALGTAIFPLLSARASAGDLPGVARACAQGIRMSLFIGLPSAVGMCVLAEPFIRVFFERGEFQAGDTVRASRALLFYGTGVWAYFLQQILVRTFYALKDSRTPVRVAVRMVLLNATLNLVLVFPMGEAGVALSTAICATLQVVWLSWVLRTRLPSLRTRWIGAGVWRIGLASLVLMIVVVLPAQLGRARWTALAPSLQVGVGVTLGVLAYAAAAWALRLDELRELLRFRSGSRAGSARRKHASGGARPTG